MAKRFLTAFLIIINVIGYTLPASSYTLESPPYNIRSPEQLVQWFKQEFTYVFKYPDYKQTPDETMRLKQGDCEDFAILSQLILHNIGIKSDVLIIKFSQINIYHAICVYKQDRHYSIISNKEMMHTKGVFVTEAVSEAFPDWEKIIFLAQDGSYGDVIERRYAGAIGAHSLAAASACGDMLGIKGRDLAMMKFALQEELTLLHRSELTLGIGTFLTILQGKTVSVSALSSIQYEFSGVELTATGLRIPCRVRDGAGTRLYYILFSMQNDKEGGFLLAVYSEEEWRATHVFKGFVPHDNPISSPPAIPQHQT